MIGENKNWFWKCFKFEMSHRQFDTCCRSSREKGLSWVVAFEFMNIYGVGREGEIMVFEAREMNEITLGKSKEKKGRPRIKP